MLVSDKIFQYAKKLPRPLQAEVLDFVEFLLSKSERHSATEDDLAWSSFSLTTAMRGMEDENMPEYTLADLKVVFA